MRITTPARAAVAPRLGPLIRAGELVGRGCPRRRTPRPPSRPPPGLRGPPRRAARARDRGAGHGRRGHRPAVEHPRRGRRACGRAHRRARPSRGKSRPSESISPRARASRPERGERVVTRHHHAPEGALPTARPARARCPCAAGARATTRVRSPRQGAASARRSTLLLGRSGEPPTATTRAGTITAGSASAAARGRRDGVDVRGRDEATSRSPGATTAATEVSSGDGPATRRSTSELDADAAELHLVVDPAHVVERAVGAAAGTRSPSETSARGGGRSEPPPRGRRWFPAREERPRDEELARVGLVAARVEHAGGRSPRSRGPMGTSPSGRARRAKRRRRRRRPSPGAAEVDQRGCRVRRAKRREQRAGAPRRSFHSIAGAAGSALASDPAPAPAPRAATGPASPA